MTQSIVVSVPHNLGVEEARRRVAAEIDQLKTEYVDKLAHSDIVWTGNSANIRVVALLQEVTGRIDVSEDNVRIEIVLPWLLARLAAPIQNRLVTTAKDALALGFSPKKT